MTEPLAPKSLKEVWAWKEESWHEVAHLPLRKALSKRLRDSARTATKLGFMPDVAQPAHVPQFADGRTEYCARRKKSKLCM